MSDSRDYMIPTTCPKCGTQLQFPMENAGDMLKCTKCFSVVKVPDLKAPPPAAQPGMPQAPANTGGEVEEFGAYSKSAEANWVDPTELIRRVAEESEAKELHEVNLEVPEHVRRRHERLVRRRKVQTTIFIVCLIIGIAALVGLMMYLQGGETTGALPTTR